MMSVHDLPAVNASLNALSGVLLLLGFTLIHRRRVELHRKVMIAAFATSSLFLICYVVYHAQVGSVGFPRQGFVRPLYYTILITHVTLAATVQSVPPSPTAPKRVRAKSRLGKTGGLIRFKISGTWDHAPPGRKSGPSSA
jgi:hypothetical protein